MSEIDPNLVWLGHVQPTGLVVSPAILRRHGHIPEDQTRADSEAVAELLSTETEAPALIEHWPFFRDVLGWAPAWVAGSPGGPTVPDDLHVHLTEADTRLAPTWAVAEPDGGWQILVRIEAPGIAADTRGALEGWEATPHQRLERLLRETGVPTGLLLTDTHLRLVHAPRGETSGWLEFPLRELAKVGGRPMLGGLKLVLGSYRLQNDGSDRRLPALLRQSREAQAEVSTQLATQVLGALHELLRGLHAADRSRIEQLAASQPAHLYEGLLSVLLRLVFLLYAEDRDLIPSSTDGAARALYDEGYGVRSLHVRLLGDEARNPDTMDERRGAWSRLLALFRIVHGGGGDGWIRGRGGKLFDPAVFPFLQGQDGPTDPPAPAPVSDGCVLRILNGLLILDGERLSYRTLDVEQIGSVYETVMGFTVETATGPTIAIKAGKNNRTPVFVDLGALLARKGTDRVKFLKDEADRSGAPPSRVTSALGAATTTEAVAAALNPIVDERGSPGGQVLPPGTPFLQPTDERRRSGSHYTPRSLTEPIVRHALAPAFERIGESAKPEDVLDLKVCDPAMGSGAFLVEACRQLATRLVAAWAKHPNTRPVIPADEDEDLLARRLVAQRCLYGVDKNPMATDLARLSLWLATLARDHEFTFLDHALRTGDSLVGLTRSQIGAMTWGDDRQGTLVSGIVNARIAEALQARAEIRDAPDDVTRAVQEVRLRGVESKIAHVRTVADAVVATFFMNEKPKLREGARKALAALAPKPEDLWRISAERASTLRSGANPISPLHWEIEFPEVFAQDKSGFDAIVGNPPFAGKNTIINGNRDDYLSWLQTLHEGMHGNADLVAHFFRRAFNLLRKDGALGLIATNTIGQGDTRASGLTRIIADGGSIARASRRLKWPGEAAVVVSVVHILKGHADSPVLDDKSVRRISAYLVEGDLDTSPIALAANARQAFQGSIVLGMGFTFDDHAADTGAASSLSRMNELIHSNADNQKVIFPYIGGEEVSSDPRHAHRRYVINFFDRPLVRDHNLSSWSTSREEERNKYLKTGIVPGDYPGETAHDWPDLIQIVREKVKPERDRQKREALRVRWWQFAEKRPGLTSSLQKSQHSLVVNRHSPHVSFCFLQNNAVFAESLIVIPGVSMGGFGVLQSRIHDLWVRTFSSTLEDRVRYTPSDCYETFPKPPHERLLALQDIAVEYYEARAKAMQLKGAGLTDLYNRFHSSEEVSDHILLLRSLHHQLDVAVLRAYSWNHLAERAAPVFLDVTNEDDERYQQRLFWTSTFRDEVIAHLLDLNKRCAVEEARQGISPAPENIDEEELEDA
jgi:hypothetical protein